MTELSPAANDAGLQCLQPGAAQLFGLADRRIAHHPCPHSRHTADTQPTHSRHTADTHDNTHSEGVASLTLLGESN